MFILFLFLFFIATAQNLGGTVIEQLVFERRRCLTYRRLLFLFCLLASRRLLLMGFLGSNISYVSSFCTLASFASRARNASHDRMCDILEQQQQGNQITNEAKREANGKDSRVRRFSHDHFTMIQPRIGQSRIRIRIRIRIRVRVRVGDRIRVREVNDAT